MVGGWWGHGGGVVGGMMVGVVGGMMGVWWEVVGMSYKFTVFLLVAKMHKYLQQVVTELNAHMEKLESLLRARSLLVPLAHHGALVHSLLHQLVG